MTTKFNNKSYTSKKFEQKLYIKSKNKTVPKNPSIQN